MIITIKYIIFYLLIVPAMLIDGLIFIFTFGRYDIINGNSLANRFYDWVR